MSNDHKNAIVRAPTIGFRVIKSMFLHLIINVPFVLYFLIFIPLFGCFLKPVIATRNFEEIFHNSLRLMLLVSQQAYAVSVPIGLFSIKTPLCRTEDSAPHSCPTLPYCYCHCVVLLPYCVQTLFFPSSESFLYD